MEHPAGREKDRENRNSTIETWRRRLGLPLAVLLPVLILLANRPENLSVVGQKALALFAGIFILYLTEALPLAATSVMIVPLAVLMGITKTGTALSGFGSSSVYLIYGAFVLAAAMVKSRLAERITYMVMRVVGDKTKNIILGVTIANIILAFLVPSSTARTAILLPVCLSILEIFHINGRSNFAKALLLILTFTNASIGAGIMTATVPNPVTSEFIYKASGHLITYGEWFVYGFPPALVMTMIIYLYVTWAYQPEVERIPGGPEYVKEKLIGLGPLSSDEKRALFVFVLVVLLWVTGTWTRIDATVACLAAGSLLFFPKIGFLTWSDASKSISWQILLVTGGGISLGDILVKSGGAKWLATSIFHILGLNGLSTIAVIVVVMIIVQYLHLVFVATTPMATGLIPIVIGIAEAMNLNPLILALPAGMIIGGYPLLMFYNTSPSILVYGTGKLEVSDFPRVGFVLCGIACLIYAIFAMTYWRWMGMF